MTISISVGNSATFFVKIRRESGGRGQSFEVGGRKCDFGSSKEGQRPRRLRFPVKGSIAKRQGIQKGFTFFPGFFAIRGKFCLRN